MARQTISNRQTVSNRVSIPTVQNLHPWSEDLSKHYTSQASVDMVNTIDGPFVGTVAGRLLDNVGLNYHQFYSVPSVTPVSIATHSVYAKAGTKSWIAMVPGSATPKAFFNLGTGTVGTTSGGAIASIESVGNGWYRCSITYYETAAIFRVYLSNGDGLANYYYTGDGTGSVYLFGLQAVNANHPGIYTKTTSAVVNTGGLRNKVSGRQTV